MSVKKVTRKDGTAVYEVRWREDGQNRSRRFERHGDANAWDVDVKRRRQLGPLAVQQLTSTGPTLGRWIADRWAPEHGATLEKRTRDRYAESYAKHAHPYLDHVPLRNLTVSKLREWQAERTAAGVSADAINKTRTFLSSVLRHAAESEAITGNPLTLVRPPRAVQKDEVEPLAPSIVETIRQIVAAPMPVEIPEGTRKGTKRAAYAMPDQRDAVTMTRDATLVAVLAYSGLRPSEALALRWRDVKERTILVQRATEKDGTIKPTKGRKSRSVRLLAPLRTDFAALRLECGHASASDLVFPRPDGEAWTSTDLGNWRSRTWRAACTRAGLDSVPRPYDLRHSFASLLLAEHQTIHYVATQLGHSPALTLRTYGHVIAEFAEVGRIDAEAEILAARETRGTRLVRAAATEAAA